MSKEKDDVCKLRLSLNLPCKRCKYYQACFPIKKKGKSHLSRKGVKIIS